MSEYDELIQRWSRALCCPKLMGDCDARACPEFCRAGKYIKQARAIHEADEAAGVVSVPVEATEKMVEAVMASKHPPTSRQYTELDEIKAEVNAAIAAGAIRK